MVVKKVFVKSILILMVISIIIIASVLTYNEATATLTTTTACCVQEEFSNNEYVNTIKVVGGKEYKFKSKDLNLMDKVFFVDFKNDTPISVYNVSEYRN